MKRIIVALAMVSLVGCGTVARIHRMASEYGKRDATNALAIAAQSSNAEMTQCAASKLDAIAKMPLPEQITGKLSLLAARQAYDKLIAQVRHDCSDVIVEINRWLALFGRGVF